MGAQLDLSIFHGVRGAGKCINENVHLPGVSATNGEEKSRLC